MARNKPETTVTVDEQQSQEVALIIDKKVLEQFAEMAVAIPSEGGGGIDEMLTKIMAATSWDQLDEPWRSTNIDDILGKPMRVKSYWRRPSTYAGGLGIFLVVKLEDPKTGKEITKSTGSVMVVGQLAAAWFKGYTNLLIKWCRADRPSANGFYPQHLEILDASTPEPSHGRPA